VFQWLQKNRSPVETADLNDCLPYEKKFCSIYCQNLTAAYIYCSEILTSIDCPPFNDCLLCESLNSDPDAKVERFRAVKKTVCV
jgi:hypothetical protein